jgi:hypothetical protein
MALYLFLLLARALLSIASQRRKYLPSICKQDPSSPSDQTMDTIQQAMATEPSFRAGDRHIDMESCSVCNREIRGEKDRDHYEAWCVG